MKKISKKLITLSLAMTMSFAMVISAYADPSPVAGSESPTTWGSKESAGSGSATAGSGSATAGSGSTTAGTATSISANKVVIGGVEYEVSLSEPTEAVKAEVNSEEKVKALLGSDYVSGSTLEVLGLQEVTLPFAIPAGGVSITFNVPGVKAGDTIKVLHKRSSDNIWEVLDAVVTDGTVTATFTSLSPVAFVKVTGGNVAADAATGATVTSPKTGESNVIYVIEILAALCLAGAFIAGRRRLAVR